MEGLKREDDPRLTRTLVMAYSNYDILSSRSLAVFLGIVDPRHAEGVGPSNGFVTLRQEHSCHD